METAGPIANISSIVVNPFLFENFISRSVNLIPSPVNKSAIPWREARLKSFANAGTSITLKLLIVNSELEILSFFTDW